MWSAQVLKASALGALWILCASCGGSRPGVTRPMRRGVVVQGSIQRYPIAGRTMQELGRALRDAQTAEGGYVGHYSARWRYRFRFAPIGQAGCRLMDVRIDLESIIRIPEWSRPEGVADSVATAWQSYIDALDDHEREHERIAVDGAGDLVYALEQLRELSCNQLGVEAERRARQAAETMQDRQARLDRDTRHGATTGATWPPPRRTT